MDTTRTIRLIFAILGLLVVAITLEHFIVEPSTNVPEKIEIQCVNVKAGDVQGSGTIFVEEIDGVDEYFVLTAAHVVDTLRVSTYVYEDDVSTEQEQWEDAIVLREVRDANGVAVGETTYPAKVMIFDEEADIAILYVGRIDGSESAEMSLSDYPPRIGTELYHCGSPGGQDLGYNSVTTGILAQTGKVRDDADGYFDQVTCASLPGSSGGGVFYVSNGVYCGMLTMGIRGTDNFSYIIPARLIMDWAEDNDLLWLFTDATIDGINPKEFNPTAGV